MGKKKPKQDEALKAKRELFCQYYVNNQAMFGNATLSYAEAFGIDLDSLSEEEVTDPETGAHVEDSEYDRQYHVCSVLGSKLLRIHEVDARITVLLNELLKDEVVDSQLAKLIRQDDDNTAKIAAVREYNKLRGRIIDRTQEMNRLPFGESDLSSVIATLPQERQDYFYGVITSLIEEAELSRSAGKTESGGTR